uniref:Cytochrome P450 n=1 Tax=Leersia perrieri TaxID=77586 RepID=A0A0D9XI26_9ORYZ
MLHTPQQQNYQMVSLLPWLLWLVLSLLSVYLLDLLAHSRRHLPPGPRPLPLIGSLHLLGDQPHRSLAGLAKKYGPLMSLRLGTVTTVVVSSPEIAREFLQKHDAVFASRSVPDATGQHARNSVPWLPNSPRWRALRRIMATELFAPHRLDALRHLRREKVTELVEHVARLAHEGHAVDVGRVAFATSLNLLSCTIFSHDLTSLDDHGASKEFQEVVVEIMEAAGCPNVSDYLPVLAAADLQGLRRRMAGLFARLHRVFDAEVDARLREREHDAGERIRKGDFLDVLIDGAARENDTSGMDRDTFRSLFTDLFGAGSDTSSSTVEWAMAELMRNPLCMARACDELSQVIGLGRNIEESEIWKLPYLQAVVKETSIIVATPSCNDNKNSRLYNTKRRTSRRICPGMPLANRVVHLVLGSLLNQFKWNLPIEIEPNGIDMSEKFGLTLAKAIPLCALVTPITVKPADH